VHKPTNNKELWAFIGAHFGVWLPFRAYSTGHSSPFGFVADAFFNPADDLAAWACRSGGKTLDASILARLAHIFTPALQGRVLSGSEDQAKNLYGYWGNWCGTVLPQQVTGAVNIKRTRINGGRFEILTASQKSVRGPKVQNLFIDELDEVDHELVEASAGMLASLEDRPARTCYMSTWHRLTGSMGKLVDGIPDNGVRLHRWNLWEAISQCPEERHEHGRNCQECPLGDDCLGARQLGVSSDMVPVNSGRHRLPGIAAEPFGIYDVRDAIKACQRVSRETWDAEYLCLRPSPQGLVYSSFDESKHGVDKAPDDLEVYRAIDWGYNTFVCLWIGVDKRNNAFLLDTYESSTSKVSTNADYIKAHRLKQIKGTFCDPAGRNKNDQTGRSDVDEFRRHEINCTFRLDRRSTEVANGIRLIRSFLNPAAGPPRFHIVRTPNNKYAIRALQSYVNRKVNGEYIDEPVKPQEHDHIPDALRYFFVNRMQGPASFDVAVKAS